jgi:hypothetical protein
VVVGIKEERGREEGRRETQRWESWNNLSPGWRTNITNLVVKNILSTQTNISKYFVREREREDGGKTGK